MGKGVYVPHVVMGMRLRNPWTAAVCRINTGVPRRGVAWSGSTRIEMGLTGGSRNTKILGCLVSNEDVDAGTKDCEVHRRAFIRQNFPALGWAGAVYP